MYVCMHIYIYTYNMMLSHEALAATRTPSLGCECLLDVEELVKGAQYITLPTGWGV